MTLKPAIKIILTVVLVICGIVARFLPHISNFTPISAIVLVLSSYFGFRYSLPALFGMMLISDFFVGFYSWPIMLSVYGSFAFAGIIGLTIRHKKSPHNILAVTLASSLLFFIITNWAVWQFGTMYIHSPSGFLQSYIMGLPFFKNSILGDLFYTGILFSLCESAIFLRQKFRSRRYQLSWSGFTPLYLAE